MGAAVYGEHCDVAVAGGGPGGVSAITVSSAH